MLDCTSALSCRLKIWNSTSTLLLCLNCQRPDVLLLHFRSALTAKDLKFYVRTFVLHWLPKKWSFASALPHCLDCQIGEVLLTHFRSVLTGKDLKFRFPHLFCQDFQRCEVPLPSFPKMWTHFCYAMTAKILPPQFRCRFTLCISAQFRAVLHEGLALQRDEASYSQAKNQNHLIHT